MPDATKREQRRADGSTESAKLRGWCRTTHSFDFYPRLHGGVGDNRGISTLPVRFRQLRLSARHSLLQTKESAKKTALFPVSHLPAQFLCAHALLRLDWTSYAAPCTAPPSVAAEPSSRDFPSDIPICFPFLPYLGILYRFWHCQSRFSSFFLSPASSQLRQSRQPGDYRPE